MAEVSVLEGSSVDVASLSDAALEERLVGLASEIFAAEARFLVLLAEFDRRERWGIGILSAAHWLSWRCGIDPATAREKVRVARALSGLPRIREAFTSGSVSYSKVRAMTRVATPAIEGELLELAAAGTAAHVERIVRGYRLVAGQPDLDGDDESGTAGVREPTATAATLARVAGWVRTASMIWWRRGPGGAGGRTGWSSG